MASTIENMEPWGEPVASVHEQRQAAQYERASTRYLKYSSNETTRYPGVRSSRGA